MAETDGYHIITNLSTPTWEMPEEDDSGLGMSLLEDASPYHTQISHTNNYQFLDIDIGNGLEARVSPLPLTELTPEDSHQFVTTLSFGNELMISKQCSDGDSINEKENPPPIDNNDTTVPSSSNDGQYFEHSIGTGGDSVSNDKQFEFEEDGLESCTNYSIPDADTYDLDIPTINPSLILTTVHLVRSQRPPPSRQPALLAINDQAHEMQSLNQQCRQGQEHNFSRQGRSHIRVVYKPRRLDPVGLMVQQEVLKSTHRDREQDRNQVMNAAFSALDDAVRVNPRHSSARRPARLTILQAAISYIRYLKVLLDIYDSENCDS